MDPSNLAAIIAPILVKGAQAFTYAAGDKLGAKVGELCLAVIDKFRGDSDAEETLALAQKRPDSGARQSALEEILAEKLKANPDFALNVQKQVDELKKLGVRTVFDQQSQTVQGPQTNTGNSNGPVLSGKFNAPITITTNPPFTGHKTKYMDQITSIKDFDITALTRFRNKLRDDTRESYPDSLSSIEFLTRSNLLVDGSLTRTGALLFGFNPIGVCVCNYSVL